MNTLKNWKIIPRNDKKYIVGDIFNHAKFKDGFKITTSAVKSFERDIMGDLLAVTFSGSIYKLEDRFVDDCDKLLDYKSLNSNDSNNNTKYNVDQIEESLDYLIKNGHLKDPRKQEKDGSDL